MTPWILLAAGIGLALLALAVWARRALRRATDRAGEIASGALLVDARANLFGRRSAGKAQLRGSGTLALTESQLVFAQAVPSRTIQIRRADIIEVGTATSFLGKSAGRPLLVVRYRDDTAAWLVRDVDAWLSGLR